MEFSEIINLEIGEYKITDGTFTNAIVVRRMDEINIGFFIIAENNIMQIFPRVKYGNMCIIKISGLEIIGNLESSLKNFEFIK